MSTRRLLRAPPLLCAALIAACVEDRSPPLAPPQFLDVASSHTLSGSILGPDGTNICNTTGGGITRVRVLNPGFPPPPAFLGILDVPCPMNSYSFSLEPGTARIRTQLPAPSIVALTLPWRTLDEVSVGEADVTHDVQILDGTALGGSATLDGSPLEGVGLGIAYDFNPNFGATSGSSGPDGHWVEFFGRSPFILQSGVRYQAGACGALGVKITEGPPSGGFLFPSEVNAINCTMVTAPAVQFSHTLTRLVVTPLPGDIGGQSAELVDQYGIGWGVQFPVAPGTSPVHVPPEASHMFLGGLIIGIAPGRVLTGTSVEGEMQCGAACRDFGLDATLGFTDQTPAGRTVLWQYSDAPSPEGIGLRIRQTSFDGVPPNDYVLFRFSIQNQKGSTVTLHAGFWADWDVDLDAGDDVGFTEMGGKLMVQTSSDPDDAGTFIGTLLRGDAPISGNFFFPGAVLPSTAEQVQALNGSLRQETAGPADLRYIHSIGPITLARGKKADLWVAVVAGENHDQLLANANAADADIANRQGQTGQSIDNLRGVSPLPLGVPGRLLSKRMN